MQVVKHFANYFVEILKMWDSKEMVYIILWGYQCTINVHATVSNNKLHLSVKKTNRSDFPQESSRSC